VLTESFTRAPRRRGVRSDVTSSRPLNHRDTSTHNALSAVSVRHQNDRRIYGNARPLQFLCPVFGTKFRRKVYVAYPNFLTRQRRTSQMKPSVSPDIWKCPYENVPTRSGRIYRPLWYVVLVKQSVHLCSYFLCATYAPFIIMSKWLHG